MTDIDKVISDEELRNRINKLIQNKKQTLVEKLSKNPLVLLLFGFLFTSIIGTYVSHKIQEESKIEHREIENRKLSLESVSQITDLIYERINASALLNSSLRREANEQEFIERKKTYDYTYSNWNSKLQSTQLKIREITEEKTYSIVESYIQYGLIPHFKNIDDALTEGYDKKIKSQEYHYNPKTKDEIKKCIDCGYVISQYLWTQISYKKDTALIKNSLAELEKRCPRYYK